VLPLDPPRSYVHLEGERGPQPEDAVRYRYADPDKDPAPLVEAERERLKTANQRHQMWEQKIGYPLVRVETHHVEVHAQLSPVEARRVGISLEALKMHLQKITGNLVLTPLRVNVDELVIVMGKIQYLNLLKILEEMYAGRLGESWHLMPEVSGGTLDRTMFFYQDANKPAPSHMAVFGAAAKSIRKAAGGKCPYWLREGFAAYCEFAVLKANAVHSVRYQVNDPRLGGDWASTARRLAAAGQLVPWWEMFSKDLRDYQLVHYVQAYAMVAYLFVPTPEKFLDFLEQLRSGRDSKAALEAAYGQTVEKLEQDWLVWLKRGR
jgi:hypothetical protein